MDLHYHRTKLPFSKIILLYIPKLPLIEDVHQNYDRLKLSKIANVMDCKAPIDRNFLSLKPLVNETYFETTNEWSYTPLHQNYLQWKLSVNKISRIQTTTKQNYNQINLTLIETGCQYKISSIEVTIDYSY